jgi:outer membrane protein TolC
MRNRRSFVWIAILVSIVMAAPSVAQQQQTPLPRVKGDTAKINHYEFSAAQTIEYAKKNSVQVKNALLDVKMQDQVNRELTAAAWPKINGAIGTTYNPNVMVQVIPNFISPSTYQVLIDEGIKDGSGNPIVMPSDFGNIAAQFGTKYSASAGVNFSQLLFDGQVFVGLQARSTAVDWKSKLADVTEESIRVNVYKIYYQLVVSKTQIELLDSNIALLTKLQNDTRAIYNSGFAERLDVDKVSVRLTNLYTEKSRVLNNIANGYYGLKVLIGMPLRDELVLTDSISDELIKRNVLEVSEYSYEDRNSYQYALLGKRLNEYNLKRYKLSLLPTLALNGNYSKSAQRNQWNFLELGGDWYTTSSISASIQVPIFNGFFTKSKIEQVKINLQATENQIEALKLSIDNEVISARNNFTTAIATLDFQKENMTLAEKVYQQTKTKYDVGTGSQTELTTAQTDLKQAQTNYINAMYDAVIAKIDYLQAIGKLSQ